MRNKTRFQYVDELRKINCLEKILPIENLYPDDNMDNKNQNNKFIRYREQPQHHPPINQDYLYNQIVSQYVHNAQKSSNQIFQAQNIQITKDLSYYNNWSESLNQEIKSKDYTFKFYFKETVPPPRLKEEANKDKEKSLNPNNQVGGQKVNNQGNNEEDANIQLPHRGKYNFYEITKYIELNSVDKDDKQNNLMRDLTIKNEILELRKLKNLEQIERIGSFYDEFNRFSYYIESPPEVLSIDFVDNSVIRQNNILSFDYFRDIGTPSRNIKDYTVKHYNQMKIKDEPDESTDIHNEYNQEKRQLLYLYFLKEEELKINKNEISFFDMANMSMGRITSKNAHMCVRSEKVTKAQYLKLLKKLEKYDLRQNQTGKSKKDKQTGTEDFQEINAPSKKQLEDDQKKDILNFQSVIDEINMIRKETKVLEEKNSTNLYNQSNFNHQIYTRLDFLLRHLLELATDKLPHKYNISELAEHLQDIQGSNDIGVQRLKILWFVANCYNEMLSKQSDRVDLRTIANIKQRQDPKLIKYKGNKIIKQQSMQPKQIYGFNNKETEKQNRSIIHKTPTKKNPNSSSFIKTPTKYSNKPTNQKTLPSTTNKKYAQTAKK